MKKIFDIFRIRREERWLALVVLVALLALNALVLCKYYDLFTPITRWYWPLFIHNFHISGFDPITYSVVSDWLAGYNVYRHPLLAFYMYVPYLINQAFQIFFCQRRTAFITILHLFSPVCTAYLS